MAFAVAFKVKKNTATKTLDDLLKQLKNPDRALSLIGEHMKDSIAENFEKEGRPTGWDQSENSKKTGRKTLNPTGVHLKNTIVKNIRNHKLFMGTNSKIGAYHQYGFKKAVRVNSYTRKTKSGKTVTVKAHSMKQNNPARKFAMYHNEDIRIAEKIVVEQLTK